MINLSLPIEDIDRVITALAAKPYLDVWQLIANIQAQARAQLVTRPDAPAPAPPPAVEETAPVADAT